MVLTPSGSPHLDFYDKMYEFYTTKLHDLIEALNIDESVNNITKTINKKLPKDIIITVTDKNLGVALVPIDWYKLTYDSVLLSCLFVCNPLSDNDYHMLACTNQ